MPTIEEVVQKLVDDYFAGRTTSGIVNPPSVYVPPPANPMTIIFEQEPSARSSPLIEYLQSMSLGLSPQDVLAQLLTPTDPTSPAIPTRVTSLGFKEEIGLAWQLVKPVGSNIRAVEIFRGAAADMSDEVSLGEFSGYFWVDRNAPTLAGYAASTTRYYRMRAVAVVAGTVYFSGVSSIVSGTTLAGGATNSDLQTRIDEFARGVQSRHILPEAIEEVNIASSLIGGLRSIAFFMGGNDRPPKRQSTAESQAFAFFTGGNDKPVVDTSPSTGELRNQAFAFFIK
jgi:hypothetical protein